MKKLALLICILFVCCLPFAAAQEDAITYQNGDFFYILLENGTAEISRYWGDVSELIIPDELDGYAVTSIGDNSFWNCYSLTNITIPDSVTSIGHNAFGGCENLISIAIPDSVISIGANPFPYCASLTEINVSPDHPVLETIDGVLFDKNDRKLITYPYAFGSESYSIPQGTLAIGDMAFYLCETLTDITIPEGVTSIGNLAFGDCYNLASITLPDSIVTIDANPFTFCSSLTEINVSPDHPVLETIDGVLFDKNERKLVCYPCAFESESYSVPEGILTIGNYAFYLCQSLTDVTIPDGVTVIGDNAFFECYLENITIPDSVTSIGDWAFCYCSSLTDVRIPDNVITIGDGAFYGCRNLTDITIPDGTTSIGDSAFSGCTYMKGITIPDSVTFIGENAFYECEYLQMAVNRGSYAKDYAVENSINYTYDH